MSALFAPLRGDGWKGLALVCLLAALATYVATLPFFVYLRLSPLIIGIVLGVLVGNLLRRFIPVAWLPGILFAAKKVLRLAIILYGFRITFQQIADVGMAGLGADIFMLGSTFLLGAFVGIRVFKIDPKLSYLIAAGASVCGAAAVLATEPVVKAESHKTAMAVATVVLFGTTAMFVYPLLYQAGLLELGLQQMGIYIGATVHEVAQVVASGNAISVQTSDTAVIVKMTRVMLLVPLLIFLSAYLSGKETNGENNGSWLSNIYIPWFAVGFVLIAGINSLGFLPAAVVNGINLFDTFLLTVAMTALGIETNAGKLKTTGGKPVLLALVLFLWLMAGGYGVMLLLERFTGPA